jgi:hypothetical protein
MAFQLSAMGSPTTNFYNDAYARAGFADVCETVRNLWLAGDRAAAIQAVPDDMVQACNLLGDEAHVRRRLQAYRDCGITELNVRPIGRDTQQRLDTLGRTVELIRQVRE